MKQHWSLLSPDERLRTLRLEDRELVGRLYEIQQELFLADFRCYLCGLRGQDALRKRTRLDLFDIEGVLGEDGELHPVAFIVKGAFATREDLVELLEQRLGSPLLEGRPALRREEWASLFEMAPHSWTEFNYQVLCLIEQAVRQAHLDRASSDTQPPLRTVENASGEDIHGDGASIAIETKSAKRRARKKRCQSQASAAAENQCTDPIECSAEMLPQVEQDELITGSAQSSWRCSTQEMEFFHGKDQGGQVLEHFLDGAGGPVLEGSATDQPVEGVTGKQDLIGRELRGLPWTSRRAVRPWPAWHPVDLAGGVEWQWVGADEMDFSAAYGKVTLKAFVQRTFIQIAVVGVPPAASRACSSPR